MSCKTDKIVAVVAWSFPFLQLHCCNFMILSIFFSHRISNSLCGTVCMNRTDNPCVCSQGQDAFLLPLVVQNGGILTVRLLAAFLQSRFPCWYAPGMQGIERRRRLLNCAAAGEPAFSSCLTLRVLGNFNFRLSHSFCAYYWRTLTLKRRDSLALVLQSQSGETISLVQTPLLVLRT